MEYYYGPNDYNKIFNYNTSNETVDQINTILNDADKLLSLCGAEYDDVTEYQLLVRCLSEQTVVEEASRRLRTKADGAYSGKENHDLAAGKNVQQFHLYCEENIMLTGCLYGVWYVEDFSLDVKLQH